MEASPIDFAWVHQARAVVDELIGLSRRHVGRLAAVTVAAPDSVPTEALTRYLQSALAAADNASCDVTVAVAPGAVRIVSLEVER